MNFQHVKILALTELSRAVLNTCTWMMEQICMHFPAYQNLIYFSCRGKSTELYQMLAIMAASDNAECNRREGIYSSMTQKNDVIEQYS